ncbi:hypothetical protein H7698_02570 [Pseudomonas sp. p50]|uniref:hypothetical protein n=1 Tax=Pseudomonas sp. p50(2008) TaxID=2816832 RepID=UPI00188AFBC5|nr:hypothetical protein [Pseudomonas sp. p50(2008)]MBF4554939.1 hypothetical protein [Pseudomonas sp. p50(2008)]
MPITPTPSSTASPARPETGPGRVTVIDTKTDAALSGNPANLGHAISSPVLLDPFQQVMHELFNSISALKLCPSNRTDGSAVSEGSIHAARHHLNMLARILLGPPLPKLSSVGDYQRRAARFTAHYYARHPGQEAFCHEHAELVLDGLSRRGLGEQALLLRIMNKSGPTPSHVLVIYADVPAIDVAKLLKPFVEPRRTAPLTISQPGMDLDAFVRYLTEHAPKLRLLDAWGTVKLLDFSAQSSPSEVKATLYPMIREGLGMDPSTLVESEDIYVKSARQVWPFQQTPAHIQNLRTDIHQWAGTGYPAHQVFGTLANELSTLKDLQGKDYMALAGSLTKACKDAGIIDCAEIWLNAQEGSLHVSEQGATGRRTSIPFAIKTSPQKNSPQGERAPDVQASLLTTRP